MNHDVTKPDAQSLPPMSSGDNELTHTMLQTGMMMPPAQPGPLGVVGRFRVLRLLGTGGMGQVLLAEDPDDGSRVAIKMIRPEFTREPWAVRRFLTEAQHMHKMSHPNVLRVFEVSDRSEGPYYVMPFIAGGSLADRLQNGQSLPREEILRIGRQVAEALGYAHSRGIIHRDLKPANILMDRDGHAYLTDFGLLRTVFNDSMVDVSKPAVEGTAPYLSPNAAAGKAEDTRCDIYAFGALLYELLTGRKPFEGANPSVVVNKILAGPPESIHKVNSRAPEELVKIAGWAMARELRDRYAEMADVVRDLDRVERGEAPLGPHGKPPLTGWAKADRWNRWIGMAGFTIAALVNLWLALSRWKYDNLQGTVFGLSMTVLMGFSGLLFALNPRKRFADRGEAFQRRLSIGTTLGIWVLCGVTLAIGLWPLQSQPPANPSAVIRPGTYSQTHNVRLMQDGSAVVTSDARFRNDGTAPVNDYSFINTPDTITAILDRNGNALPFDVTREGDHYRYTARLQTPLRPGEEFIGKTVSRIKSMVRQDNGVWTYERHHTPIPETVYSETVILPPKAELVSAQPGPTRQTMEDGALHLVFETHLAENQSFDCVITYRLQVAKPARNKGPGPAAGLWETVDFVKSMDQFDPARRRWEGDFAMSRLEIAENGKTSLGDYCLDGWLAESNGKIRFQYQVQNLGGTDYLFLPWLSGDVTIRGRQPCYYVYRRLSEAGGATSTAATVERLCAQGWRFMRERNMDEAEKRFERATGADPRNADAWNGLGWSRFNQGMPVNAEEAFKKCLDLTPDHAAALNGLGWISKNRGDRQTTIQYWDQAVRATPQATAALRGLALTYKESGDNAMAAKCFQMWLDTEPDNAEAKAGLLQTRPLVPVTYSQGLNTLQRGDAISLTEVSASSTNFAVGDTVRVKGAYTLASRPQARLALYVTATKGDGRGPVQPEQWQKIEKGSGEFTLSQTIDDHGCLHLTFYDTDSGKALGGFYFGTQSQVDEITALSSESNHE